MYLNYCKLPVQQVFKFYLLNNQTPDFKEPHMGSLTGIYSPFLPCL